MTERKKSIKEKAVLVRLIFRNGVRFTITDKPVTQEVEERHQTSKTGRYVKVLFKREAIHAIFDAETIAKKILEPLWMKGGAIWSGTAFGDG